MQSFAVFPILVKPWPPNTDAGQSLHPDHTRTTPGWPMCSSCKIVLLSALRTTTHTPQRMQLPSTVSLSRFHQYGVNSAGLFSGHPVWRAVRTCDRTGSASVALIMASELTGRAFIWAMFKIVGSARLPTGTFAGIGNLESQGSP